MHHRLSQQDDIGCNSASCETPVRLSDFGQHSASMTAIRAERPEDAEAVHELLLRCFPTAAEASLVRALRESGDAAFSFVALASGTVIGHVLFSHLLAPQGALALAPVAVEERWREQGVAASLIRTGLALAKARGIALVVRARRPRLLPPLRLPPGDHRGHGEPLRRPQPHGALAPQTQPSGTTIEYAPAFDLL